MPLHDVIILGSGLAGSVAAACLARAGVDVLVLDAGRHPRFAVGESTIPYTSIMTSLIAERYGVPEIGYLADFTLVRDHVSTNCGIKRNFGFVYHQPHRPHDPAQANQFPIYPGSHAESHLLRADVDHWMILIAQKYGATLREQTTAATVDVDDQAVSLTLSDGSVVTGKFLIDASGFRSPLAQKYGLREEPSRLRTHSRSIFTHMTGVEPFERTSTGGSHGNPSPWSQGTLHHLFPGGWMWVIPFDNYAGATSDACSVGISFDPRMHPKPEGDPAAEFSRFLAEFPDISQQFLHATAIRPWVSTGRLQYSSTRTVGYRWCLTAHAAGFIDALFSRGLQNTMAIIHALVWRVIEAVREDDFSVDRFEYIQELEQGLLDANDMLVANAYTSFADWELWNAWFRVWEAAQVLSTGQVFHVYSRFLATADPAVFAELERVEPCGAIPDYAPARAMIEAASGHMRRVQEGQVSPALAADAIFGLLSKADFIPPLFGLARRSNRWYRVTPASAVRTAVWARTKAPPPIAPLFARGLGAGLRQHFGHQLRTRLTGREPEPGHAP
jgi:FADH2 O2-dependent halogenase